ISSIDDVTSVQQVYQFFNKIDIQDSLHKQDDSPRLLQLGDHLLQGVSTNHLGAFCLIGQEIINFGDYPIKSTDHKAMLNLVVILSLLTNFTWFLRNMACVPLNSHSEEAEIGNINFRFTSTFRDSVPNTFGEAAMHFNDPGLLPTAIRLLQSSSSSTWKGAWLHSEEGLPNATRVAVMDPAYMLRAEWNPDVTAKLIKATIPLASSMSNRKKNQKCCWFKTGQRGQMNLKQECGHAQLPTGPHSRTFTGRDVALEGHVGKMLMAATYHLPHETQLRKMRTASLQLLHMEFPHQNNTCSPPTRQEFPRFLVMSSDVHFKTAIWILRSQPDGPEDTYQDQADISSFLRNTTLGSVQDGKVGVVRKSRESVLEKNECRWWQGKEIRWRRVHPPNTEKEVTGVNIQTAIAKVTEGVIQQGTGMIDNWLLLV
ncbi:hypothetical protein EI555_017546, partial [Monodon monoceros]